jgi:hypothetical protein
MLVYFVGSKFLLAASSGEFTGGVVAILFGYYFFQGTRAAFRLHKRSLEDAPQEIGNKKKSLAFKIGLGVLAVILIPVVILFVLAALGPVTEVVPGRMLDKKYVSFIRDNGLIEASEQIEFWYSDALNDFRNGFYCFTDRQVLLYNKNWGESSISVPFSSILDIDFQKDPSFFDDSKITMLLSDSSTVFFPVSSDNEGDEMFVERMKQLWEQHRDVVSDPPDTL